MACDRVANAKTPSFSNKNAAEFVDQILFSACDNEESIRHQSAENEALDLAL